MKTKRILVAMVSALLVLFAITGCNESSEPGTSQIDWENHDQRAEQFIMALINGDYSIAAAGFDTDMNRGIGVYGLRRNWEEVTRQAGSFVSIVGIEIIPHDDFSIYEVTTQHESNGINSRVVFSEDGVVAGLHFTFADNND